MIKNYLTISLRLFRRNKIYSFINIIGFSIGLAGFLLIMIFIRHELSYDKFWDDYQRIYRVTRSWYNEDGAQNLHLARVAAPIGPLLDADYPDLLEEVVRTLEWSPVIRIGDDLFRGDYMFFAEENFFRVFNTGFIRGDPSTALKEPLTMVISETTAERFFGDEDPVGKTVETQEAGTVTVTGVFRDIPQNTHFKYDILISFITLEYYYGKENMMRDWSGNNYITYLKFSAGTPPDQLKVQIDDFIDRHLPSTEYASENPDYRPSESTRLHLQKITDIHLRSHLSTELESNGDIRNVYIFSTVALFILLIACMNFINLSTARSAIRAKEVAVRKVAGAGKNKLVFQFLFESVLLTFLALIIAVVAVDFLLPVFSNLISRELSFFEGSRISNSALIILIGLLVGLLSGSYPAFYLSRFAPVKVLKAAFDPEKSSLSLRTILVFLQFAISIALIISMGIIGKQIDYIQNKDLGFNRKNVLVIGANQDILNNIEIFKQKMLENPGISGITSARLIPSDNLINSGGCRTLDGENPGPIPFRVAMVSMDYDYFENFKIKILAGRNFSREFPTDDSLAFMLNAEAVKQLGWGNPENAVDRPIEYGGRRGTVIGVVDDICFESLHNKITPIIYFVSPSQNYQLCLVLKDEGMEETIQYIKKVWEEYAPGDIFDYTFLDERYEGKYRTEFQLGKVMLIFSAFAILIACLGLFGLSSFLAEQKTREVGIRKIMGASVLRITTHLSIEFTRWVLIANIIAWPAAYFIMKRWLENFAYHVNIPWLVFFLALIISLAIAVFTVSFQTIRSAFRNPVEAIKYE